MTQAIDFYFDFSSPYGYLASCVIDDIATRHSREVIWRPYLVGVAFSLTSSKPLLEKPMIGEYAKHDIQRSARLAEVPFEIPSPFPIATAAAGRTFYWLYDQNPELANHFAKNCYRAYFVDNINISKPAAVVEIAAELGVDKTTLSEALLQPDVKARFKTETDAAIVRGVFGSPFIFVDEEPFWGNDRLPQVERWLETGGW